MVGFGSQGQPVDSKRSDFRRYYTQKMNLSLNAIDQDYQLYLSKLERQVFETKPGLNTEKITIPIVFHILYAPGRPYPAEEQVWWQLAALNRDFAATDYRIEHPADTIEGFAKRVADAELSFCIPGEIPYGKQTITGIHYVETNRTEWGPNWDMCAAASGGADPVDPDQYLNVWVVDLADTVSGWATYPLLKEMKQSKPESGFYEGIVISFDYFGQDRSAGGTAAAMYNEGKTLTHLAGNYLGLFDLWSENQLCADDYIDDTPIHNAPNFGCEAYKHVSTCHEQPVEMIMNFMDNSDDACQRMFTHGQKLRMQAMFAPGGPREELIHTPVDCSLESLVYPIAVAPVETIRENIIQSEGVATLDLAIWPNPASSSTNLEIRMSGNPLAGPLEILIYNSLAQLQSRITANVEGSHFQDKFDTSAWPSGTYWAVVYTRFGIASSSFIVQN